MYLAPSLIAAMASFFVRGRTFVPLLCASALPPAGRYLLGPATPDAAFERLSMNPFWFVLVWLPAAIALMILSRPRDHDTGRVTAFGLPLWRFGAAFVLMFVVLTFVSKSGLGEMLLAIDVVVSFLILFLGIAFLIAGLVPARAELAALQWTWLVMGAISLTLAVAALNHVMSLDKQRKSIRSDIESARSTRALMAETFARFEKNGRVTFADRRKVGEYLADYDARERDSRAALVRAESPARAGFALLLPALLLVALFAGLFVQAWRYRKAPPGRRRSTDVLGLFQ